MEHDYVLHLGSNQGDRLAYLKSAFNSITSSLGEVTASSNTYETAPWGVTDQQDFYNVALRVRSMVQPFMALRRIQQIEHQLGRLRKHYWGPRTIDIDILYCDELIVDTSFLTLPHPRLHLRNFVLFPLLEVVPNWIHPIFGTTTEQLLAACQDPCPVTKTLYKIN